MLKVSFATSVLFLVASCSGGIKQTYEVPTYESTLDKLYLQEEATNNFLYELYFTSSIANTFDNVLTRTNRSTGDIDTLYTSNMIFDFSVDDNDQVKIRLCHDVGRPYDPDLVTTVVDTSLNCRSRTARFYRESKL